MNKAVLGLMVCVLFFAGCGKEEKKEPEVLQRVKVAAVKGMGEQLSRRYPGIAKGADEVDLAFRVPGVLEERPINPGNVVSKGQLLAQLEQQDFYQDIQTTEGNLESAHASKRRSEADLKRVLKIQKEDPGAIDQRSVDRAKAQYESDIASVKSLEAQLTTAKNRLTYTTLIAPFDARVIQVFPENYQRVREGEVIVRLINYGITEIELSVPEVVMPHLERIAKIDVHFEVYPDQLYPASIYEIGAEASPTTRTYPITLRLSGDVDEVIYPGMAGVGILYFNRYPDSKVIVPESTQMIDDLGQSYVWVIKKGNLVDRRDVKVVRLEPKGLVISEGLQEGEIVVTSGAERLEQGQKIQPIALKGWP